MVSKKNKVISTNPLTYSRILSYITFSWTYNIFKKGRKDPLEVTDLYKHLEEHSSGLLGDKFYKIWNEDLKAGSPSIINVIFKCYKWEFIIYMIVTLFLECVLRVIQPILLGYLIISFIDIESNSDTTELYCYAIGLVLCSLTYVMIAQTCAMGIVHLAMKIRVACCSLIYRKSLKLSHAALSRTSIGKTVNLISNDIARFDTTITILNYIVVGPVQATIMTVLMWQEIGVSSLIGIAVFLIMIPLQFWLGKKTSGYRRKTTLLTDRRVGLMNEILSGIKVIKMYAWEKPFSELVKSIRKQEIKQISHTSYIRGVVSSFGLFNSRFAVFCSILCYALLGNELTSKKVFVIISFYGVLKQSMAILFPYAITSAAELSVTLKRIQEFMCLEEVAKSSTASLRHPHLDKKQRPPTVILETKTDEEEAMIPFFSHNNVKEIKLKWKASSEMDLSQALKNSAECDNLNKVLDKTSLNKDIILDYAICLEKVYVKLTPNDHEFLLNSITLNIKPGSLVAVIGPVGAGKTSLLYTLLKELPLHTGNFDVFGEMSYASQEAWLYGGTIRENILFGSKMDRIRYNTVIRKCALDRDFSSFLHGDKTIVHDKGTNLSGGQRARINLGRAIYRNADIYLLDDPLSSVDAKVGRHLFDSCIKDYLGGKTRVLVTHQLQYLNQVDQIVVMDNGGVIAEGTYDELSMSSPEFSNLLSKEANSEEKEILNESLQDVNETMQERPLSIISELSIGDDHQDNNLEEKAATGSIESRIYKLYALAGRSKILLFMFIIVAVLSQILLSGSDYWISYWVNSEETRFNNRPSFNDYYNDLNDTTPFENYTTTTAGTLDDVADFTETANTDDGIITTVTDFTVNAVYNISYSIETDQSDAISREPYMYIYAVLVVFLVLITLVRSYLFFWLAMKSSLNLHNGMLKSIMGTTMRFFASNPVGRIINRFSKDMGSVDELLPLMMIEVIQTILHLIGVVFLVSIVNVWLLVPSAVICSLFFVLRTYYLSTSRSLKRLEGITRSPMYSHLGNSFHGMATIRAFGNQRFQEKEFDSHQNLHSSAWFMFIGSARAFGYLLDLICVSFIAIVTFSFLLQGSEILGSNVGLAITQVIALTASFQYGIKQSAEMENYMTSVERILEYNDIEQEPPSVLLKDRILPTYWPHEGRLEFKNVCLRYVPAGAPALNKFSVQIHPREKIGIVGRTGAGKSSIINALFRMSFMNGIIEIDGIDTSKIGLQTLRNKISIIPQEPVLFSGTMRTNLDPFNEYTDETLWKALEQVELKYVVSELANGLNADIAEGGSNFSVGQRQLICLARAIVRQNRIIVLDEATANVDYQTDSLIQKTIRENFSQCTILTIAHRLQTIMDSDKVIVMDTGSLVEFDHPHILLQDDSSMFSSFVKDAGKDLEASMTTIAQQNYEVVHSKIS